MGATAVLLLGAFASLGLWAISTGSILGALAAMATVFAVARQGGTLAPTQLILCGVVMAGPATMMPRPETRRGGYFAAHEPIT